MNRLQIIILSSSVIALACFGNARSAPDPSAIPVWLVSRGYHTGLVLPSKAAAGKIMPLAGESGGYAEFGWGESRYYQSPTVELSDAPRALFFSSGSVVRLEFCGDDLESKFSSSGFVLRFDLTGDQFEALCRFIDESFVKKDGFVTRESIERNGAVGYYTSVHHYSIINTCNTWAARALEAAGTGMSSAGIIFAFQLRSRSADRSSMVK